jgi:hypothetical protein
MLPATTANATSASSASVADASAAAAAAVRNNAPEHGDAEPMDTGAPQQQQQQQQLQQQQTHEEQTHEREQPGDAQAQAQAMREDGGSAAQAPAPASAAATADEDVRTMADDIVRKRFADMAASNEELQRQLDAAREEQAQNAAIVKMYHEQKRREEEAHKQQVRNFVGGDLAPVIDRYAALVPGGMADRAVFEEHLARTLETRDNAPIVGLLQTAVRELPGEGLKQAAASAMARNRLGDLEARARPASEGDARRAARRAALAKGEVTPAAVLAARDVHDSFAAWGLTREGVPDEAAVQESAPTVPVVPAPAIPTQPAAKRVRNATTVGGAVPSAAVPRPSFTQDLFSNMFTPEHCRTIATFGQS